MAKADRVSEPPTRVLRWFERVQIADFRPLTRLAGTLAIFAAAWAARVLLDPMLPSGFPYVTFFPAVILTAFLFGLRAGLLLALLCGGVAWYFFIPPLNSFSIAGAEVAIGLYVFVVGTDLVLLHGMRAANRQLRLERQNSLDLAAAKEQQAEELRRAIAAVRDSEVKTQLATRTAGMGIWQWHIPSDRVQWDETMFALYGMAPTPDGTVRYGDYIAHLHPEDAEAQDTRLKRTVAEVSESTREFRIRRSDDSRWRQLRAVEVARAGPDGRTEWVVGTNLDITAEKERESHIRLLLGEVNHRAKNLLAVVLSVARRTSGSDHETFMTNFAARIQSLAAGQDLLVRNAWRGVGLQALVAAQLGHFKDLVGSRILIEGEEIALAPPGGADARDGAPRTCHQCQQARRALERARAGAAALGTARQWRRGALRIDVERERRAARRPARHRRLRHGGDRRHGQEHPRCRGREPLRSARLRVAARLRDRQHRGTPCFCRNFALGYDPWPLRF